MKLHTTFLSAGLALLASLLLSAGPRQTTYAHTYCDATASSCDAEVLNFCYNPLLNCCRKCPSPALEAMCKTPSENSCTTEQVIGGCGEIWFADCNPDGQCINWHAINESQCFQWWCY